jgi:glutamate racemase
LFDFDSPAVKNIIRDKLMPLDMSLYGFIVLGCTHFIYYREIMREMIPETVRIIDGNEGTVRNMKAILESGRRLNAGTGGRVLFYDSGRPVEDPERLSRLSSLADLT